jgi:enamine deaminase RidA (YjgF/YER057c/UK114 family)
MLGSVERRMDAIGLVLPEAPAPLGNYARGVDCRGLYMLSGQLPLKDGEILLPGRLGESRSIEEGKTAAEQASLNALAQIRHLLGGFDRLEKLLRVDGLVACAPGFHDIAAVLDGASDLFAGLLGERGRHARSAAGVVSLPRGASVELVLTFAARQ